MPEKPRRSLRRRIAFCLVIAAVIFGVLEVAVRLFWEHPPETVGTAFIDQGVFRGDASCGWRMRPGVSFEHALYANPTSVIHTNSRGLRSPEYPVQRSNNKTRILVLGDSFAFGWGVDGDQNFAALLRESRPSSEVLNLGVSGYNVAQSHRLLTAEGLRYRPDLVVFAMCHNDVTQQVVPTIEEMRAMAHRRKPRGWKAKLCEYSRLLEFLRYSASVVRPLRRTLQAVGLKEADGGYEILDENVRPSLREYPSSLRAEWTSTIAELRRLRSTCAGAGAKFLVILIPPRQFAVPGALAETLAYVRFDSTDFEPGKCGRVLGEACAAASIPFVDAMPALDAPDDRFYLRADMHLNPAGHRVLAEVLLPELDRLLRGR